MPIKFIVTPQMLINLLSGRSMWSVEYSSGIEVCRSSDSAKRLLDPQVQDILANTVITNIETEVISSNHAFVTITIEEPVDVLC